jgi:hypothetical protein
LKTESVTAEHPFAEVEYRAALARMWGSSDGRLGVADSTSLEYLRLQRGIPLERAQEHEKDIRAQLAREIMKNLNYWYLSDSFHQDLYRMRSITNVDETKYIKPLSQLRQIGKALRLDAALTQTLFFRLFPDARAMMYFFDQAKFGDVLYKVNNVSWANEEDVAVFQPFVESLPKGDAK